MIKEDVKHLFDRSACLTKRQFEAYLSGNMITEEVYAIEHHINGCPLCSMAMDGMQLRKDALVVANQLNTDFLADHLAATPQQSASNAASYVKSLKPKEISTKPLITGVKVLVAIGACAGILWFVQSVGKNNSGAKTEEPQQEEVVNVATPPQQEEQSVVVEEPLMAEQPATEEPVAEPDPAPVKEQPAIGPPEDKLKPVTTKPATAPVTTTKPAATTAKQPVTAVKPTVVPPTKPVTKTTAIPATKPAPTPAKPPVAKPAPPVVKQEEPKAEPPKPVVREEPKPQPKAEQPAPAPAPKKEPVEELPNDPIAAGKTLMDKRNYNAAINRMRSEMRSSNKARRQEAVILVAKCYQQLGNKDRAAELLKSVVDEGGPEKKNAKKLLKEVDKNAAKEEE